MSKAKKIIYWVATTWLSLGMVSTGIVQVLQLEEETAFIKQLGYPAYLIPMLGFTKLLGVIVLLLPRLPLLKEWVYAGFVFTMAGALFSHISAGSGIADIAPPILLLVLTMVSWYCRPASRKSILLTTNAAA